MRHVFLMHDDEKSSEHARHLSVFKTLRTIFADRRVYVYLLLGLSGLFGFGIIYSFVPTKSHVIGLEEWQIGLIVGAGALAFSVMSLVTGIIADRGHRKKLVVASQIIIIASGIGLALWSSGFVSLLLLYCLFCVGEAIAFLLSFVYASKAFNSRHMSTAMGSFNATLDLSIMVGPLIGASVYAATQQFAPVFYIICVPAVLGLFSLIWRSCWTIKSKVSDT